MEADEQEAGQPALKVEEKADQVQDAIKAEEAGQQAVGSTIQNFEQAAPNKAGTGPADTKKEESPPAEAAAQQGVGAELHQQEQPAIEQDADVAAADRAGTGAEGCAAAPQPQAADGRGKEDMPDAADAAQGEPGTAAEHEEDAEAPAKALGRQGSARGRSQRGRGKRGGRGKGAMSRKRSARSQRLEDGGSSGDMAADVAGGPENAAPLSTRRSLRSQTTCSKIDPAEFATKAEVDEDADASPAPGASPLALQNGDKGEDPGSRGVSVPVGEADTAEATAIEDAHRGKDQKATTSADAKTDSIAESDDSIPLAQLVDIPKKRPTASALGEAAARKRHKSDTEPAAAAAAKAEATPAAEKGGPATKRAENTAPDQAPSEAGAPEMGAPGLHAASAPAEQDAPPAAPAAAPGERAAHKGTQDDVKKPSMSPSNVQRLAQQPRLKATAQKSTMTARPLDPATRHAKQISDELDKCSGEFLALQKKQADVAQKVQSYLGHLDGMTFSINQLRASMVGKAAKRISRWALEPTSQEAALHAKNLCDAWMKAMGDQSKPQHTSKAPAQPAKVTPQEQRAKQQVTPATDAKRTTIAIAAASNGVTPRAENATAAGQSKEAGAGAAGPPASKKLLDAREWCLQHLLPISTGNARRDQGLLILWNALMPHAELPPAEAARKLEAAVHARYARGNGDNATADPGAEYIRRLRVLWGWLSPDSNDAAPQLKRMLLQGELPCEELASMNGQQLKALIEPAAAAADAATAAASAPGLANGTTAVPPAPNAGTQPYTQTGPTTLTPEQGTTALAVPSAPPTETTAVDGAAQETPQQEQQQQRGAEQDNGVRDMDIEGVPRSPFAAVKLERFPVAISTAPQPSWGLKSEPSLQFWAGNTQQPQEPPGVSQPAAASGAATSETRAGGAEQPSAASSQPPPPPAGAPDLAAASAPDLAAQQPGSTPDLAVAAAAVAPDLVAQQQPKLAPADVADVATPAGFPGHGEGTAPRGSLSAPPASHAKPALDPDQAEKGYSRNAGVLFAWGMSDGDASAGPHGMPGSNVDACQGGTTADDAHPM
ncbi:g4761 [Coccomyxa elongata]